MMHLHSALLCIVVHLKYFTIMCVGGGGVSLQPPLGFRFALLLSAHSQVTTTAFALLWAQITLIFTTRIPEMLGRCFFYLE